MVRVSQVAYVAAISTVLALCVPTATPLFGQVRDGQYVVVRDGHFRLGNERIRFGGVNASPCSYLDKHHLEMFANRVHALGFNAVRAHYYLAPLYGTAIDKREFAPYAKNDNSMWDGLDYLLSLYRKMGIYCYGTEVFGPMPLTPAAYDILPDDGTREAWQAAVAGIDLQAGINPLPWALAYFDDRVAAVKLQHWRNILNHVNQHTGKRYAEDEIFAVWQLTNETAGSVVGILLGDTSYTHEMPGFFRQQITRRWNEFLENKYATNDTLRAGWGPLAAALSIGEIPLPTQRIQPTQVLLPSPVYADLIAFGMERWQKHTAACTALFRSLAPKGIGSNVAPLCAGATPNPVLPMAYASALGDFVAANDYHYMLSADPRNPLSPWRSRLMEPPVLHAGLGLAVADKPFVIYEGNVHKPAPYRAEYPLFDALAACWQDYDGVFMHALGALKPRDDEPWTEPLTYAFNGPWKTLFDGCLAWTDEIQCAGFRTAGEIYRQGLVAPAPRPATVTIGRRAIYGPEYYRYGRGLWDERQALPSLEWTQTVHGGRILYDPTWDGTVKTQGQIAAQPTTAVTWGRGPEVRWDWPRGQVVVDTPGCSALAGFGWRNHRFSTGVAISGLNRPYVSITLASQDGAPISSSRRLICSCLSTGENTGLRVDATKMKSFALQGGRRYVHGAESLQAMVVDPGTAPVRIQRVTCTVSLPRLPGRVCRKLDFSLKCIAEQPAETGFTLTETEPVFVCQLVAP